MNLRFEVSKSLETFSKLTPYPHNIMMAAVKFWQGKFTFSFWEHWKYPRFKGPQEINVDMRRDLMLAGLETIVFPKRSLKFWIVFDKVYVFKNIFTFIYYLFTYFYFSAYGFRGRCNVYSRQRGQLAGAGFSPPAM